MESQHSITIKIKFYAKCLRLPVNIHFKFQIAFTRESVG